jgi:peptidyl-dipeptidase Dcp
MKTTAKTFLLPLVLLIWLTSCAKSEAPSFQAHIDKNEAKSDTTMRANPFLSPSTLDFHYPPFDQINIEHYRPAFEQGMREEVAEIEAIANQTEAPSFENTLVAMERSGRLLGRVNAVFFALISAHTNDDLEAIRTEMSPKLAAHRDRIALNPNLFARIKSLHQQQDTLGLDSESLRLLNETYKSFVRAGAELNDNDKEILKTLNAEMAELGTQFSQKVLKEVNDLAIVVDNREQLIGLDKIAIDAAAKRATEKGLNGKFLIPLLNTSDQPPLATLENRQLRQRIHNTSLSRGSRGGEFDTRGIVARMMKLRAERAQLLGFSNHAEYQLENQTAKTVGAVNQRLAQLTPAAVGNARREAADLQEVINRDGEGGEFQLEAWDWAYYSEKVRQERYAFDESQLRPYFELNSVLQNGVFFAANQLYGISFQERFDLPVYQEDVRVFDVSDADGSPLAIFIADFYARPSKRGGAWMNAYVSQSELLGTKPVVANHLNIPKPSEGEATLLTWDEVTTMFHEFGHALHGMFSHVRYPNFAGTSVPRDFVEYPSQVNEMWAIWPTILQNYARHYQTAEPMPQALLEKVLATQKFNQGFATTEYLAASLLDQAWHQLNPDQVPDAEGVVEFEAEALRKAGVDFSPVPPRYRSTYFSHIMSGYSAGYYSYIWSEVLDADTVEWFKENGGLKRENGDHFRDTLLSKGGSAEAMTLFKNFRGRDPDIAPLLERRGLN